MTSLPEGITEPFHPKAWEFTDSDPFGQPSKRCPSITAPPMLGTTGGQRLIARGLSES